MKADGDMLADLIARAIDASDHAYTPYSGYPVGAALRGADGRVFTGCNVENAAFPATICAERTALVKAISEGQQTFDTLVVATRDAGSPCGLCRQMLSEFAPELRVLIVDFDGQILHDMPLDRLLPHSFGPQSLEQD